MLFQRNRIPFLLTFGILVLVSLACNLPLTLTDVDDATPIPISTESANELKENVEEAAATAFSGGSINLVITEQQLTSIAADELQSMPEGQMIKEFQIRLQDGQINLSANVINGNLTFPFQASINVSADSNGNLQTQVVSANVGMFPLPQNIIDQLNSQINQALIQSISAGGNRIFIENIEISNGYLTVIGHLQ